MTSRQKSGLADSPFFKPLPKGTEATSVLSTKPKEKAGLKATKTSKTTKQPNNQTTIVANNQTTKQPKLQTTKQPNNQATKVAYINSFLSEPLTEALTIRFPFLLMERLEDVQSQIRKRFKGKGKLTKQRAIIGALALLLWDFEEHGDDSALYHQLVERKE